MVQAEPPLLFFKHCLILIRLHFNLYSFRRWLVTRINQVLKWNESFYFCRSPSASWHFANINPSRTHDISSEAGEEGDFRFYKRSKQGMACPRGDRGGWAQDAVDAGMGFCLKPELSAANTSSSLELGRAILFLSSWAENSCVITWLCLPSCCGCHRTRESIEAAGQGFWEANIGDGELRAGEQGKNWSDEGRTDRAAASGCSFSLWSRYDLDERKIKIQTQKKPTKNPKPSLNFML